MVAIDAGLHKDDALRMVIYYINSMWSALLDAAARVLQYRRIEYRPCKYFESVGVDDDLREATRALQEVVNKFTADVFVYRPGCYVDTVKYDMNLLLVTYVFCVLSEEEREPMRRALVEQAASDERYVAACSRLKRNAPPGTHPSASGRYLYNAAICPVFRRIHDRRLKQETQDAREREKLGDPPKTIEK